MDLKDKLIKEFEETSPRELVNAPVYALQGVSKRDAKLLHDAFYIDTIGDLAHLKYADWAREICDLADRGREDADMTPFRDKLIKKYENKTPAQLAKAPVYALQGVSPKDAERLYKAFKLKTVRQLAQLKYIHWAREIVLLALPPKPVSAPVEEEKKSSRKTLITLLIIFLVAIVFILFMPHLKKSLNKYTVKQDLPKQAETVKPKVPEKAPVPPVKEKEPVEDTGPHYLVKKLDTLQNISKEVFGKESEWKKIYELNRESITDPNMIHPGQKLKLPEEPKKR